MRPARLVSLALLAGVALAPPLAASSGITTVLTAVDGKCITTSGQNFTDNRLRAYWGTGLGSVDGFVKFDLSSIPDGATITSLKLTTFHEQGFGNPSNGPVVSVHRVQSDAWSSSTTGDAHPGLAEKLTPSNPGPFPSADLVPVDWDLDVNAVNWSQDLADDLDALALHNDNAAQSIYSYVYFYNAAPNPAPPTLTVRYTTGPHLEVANFVAGQNGVVTLSSFTPNGQAALLMSGALGPLSISSACGTQSFDVGLPVFVFFLPLGPTGTLTLAGALPSDATGVTLYFHALDIQSCEQSNAVPVTIG